MEAMTKVSPVVFFQQVLSEARKVSWATRSQAVATTLTVAVFVLVSSFFFSLADLLARYGVKFLLGLGR
jgi:preprotein translocase SecE subunit